MTNHIFQYSVAHSKYSSSKKKGQGNGKEGLHHTKPEMQGDKHSILCLHVLQLGWRCHDVSNNGLGQPHPDSRAICSPHVLVLECLHSLSGLQLFLAALPSSWHLHCSLGFIFTASHIASQELSPRTPIPLHTAWPSRPAVEMWVEVSVAL